MRASGFEEGQDKGDNKEDVQVLPIDFTEFYIIQFPQNTIHKSQHFTN